MTATLRVVDGGAAPQAVDVEAAEAAVLARAIEDMSEWITALPSESGWSWSFRQARTGLVDRLANMGGAS